MGALTDDRAVDWQRGYTMIEVMVSLAIGMVLLLAMGTLLSRQSASRAEVEKAAAQLENGRHAISHLKDNLAHAGFYGQFGGVIEPPATTPEPCETSAPLLGAALAYPVQGYDAPAALPAAFSHCIAAANYLPGTDILIVRRASSRVEAGGLAGLSAGLPYIQATPAAFAVADGGDTSSLTLTARDGVAAAPVRRLLQHIYFISPCTHFAAGQSACTAAADGGAPVPSLKRLELAEQGGEPAHALTTVAEGVEDMQIDYGVAPAGAAAPSVPFLTAPTQAQLPDVVSLHLHLLVRNPAPSAGHTDTKTYRLGQQGESGPFNDRFKRHVFTSSVRLTNVAGRRE